MEPFVSVENSNILYCHIYDSINDLKLWIKYSSWCYLFKWLSNELGTNLPCHFCVCLLCQVHKENMKTSVWDAFSVWELLGKLQGSAKCHSPLGLTSVKLEKERSRVPFPPLWICTLCLGRMFYLIEGNYSIKRSLPFPFCGYPVSVYH